MKVIISERQYKLLTEDEERKVLKLPGVEVFGGWEGLQAYLNKKGNPLFTISGDLNLKRTNIETIDNLVSVGGDLDFLHSNIKSLANLRFVGGDLDLRRTKIKSLDNLVTVGGDLNLKSVTIESLDNLVSVGGYLNLHYSSIRSLKNLVSVGTQLYIQDTPFSYKYSEEEIKQQIEVGGDIYM